MFSTEALDSCKSQNIRFYSGDTADKTDDAFEIENGVLKKYHGDANDVVIPDGVTSIGDFAFQNCESLTAVKIADSVTSIGNFAFWGCSALASVYIPDGLTSIGDGAFQTCDALAAIDIPESVMHIGRAALQPNVTSSTPSPVFVPDTKPEPPKPDPKPASPLTDFKIKRGVLIKYLGNSEDVVIPEGVTEMGHFLGANLSNQSKFQTVSQASARMHFGNVNLSNQSKFQTVSQKLNAIHFMAVNHSNQLKFQKV